jgi:hypothetical protein
MNSLKEQYDELHKNPHNFRGFQVVKHADAIQRLIDKTDSNTLLDYGCGKADGYKKDGKFHDIVTLYDPYYEPFSKRPEGKFDGVLCCDVLEHIPPENMAETILDIFGYAEKFVYFTISTRLAKKTLPDGRNAHLTVLPKEWWIGLIRYCLGERDLKVIMNFED